MPPQPIDVPFWILVSSMTVIIISVIVAFAIVINNIYKKINKTNDAIDKVAVQDETNLLQAGLDQRSQWNQEIGNVSANTIKVTTKTDKRVNELGKTLNDTKNQVRRQEIDGVSRHNDLMRNMTYQEARVQREFENAKGSIRDILAGEIPFDRLAVGTTKIFNYDGDVVIDSQGKPQMASRAQLKEYGVPQESIDFLHDFAVAAGGTGDEFLMPAKSKLMTPNDGIGLTPETGISAFPLGNMRIYAPNSENASISVGFNKQDKTFKDTIRVENNSTTDRVGIHGDVSITGRLSGPTIAELDHKIAVLDEQVAKYKYFVMQEKA